MSEQSESAILPQASDKQVSTEVKAHHAVAVVTSTSYKNWYPGEPKNSRDSDKIRGDLALESMREAIENGYRVVVVDSGSSQGFIDDLGGIACKDNSVHIYPQQEGKLSASRREGFKHVQESLSGVEVICTMEPEKDSLIASLDKLSKPIREGRADIVIPRRSAKAFETYPPVQAEKEQTANRIANRLLRQALERVGKKPSYEGDIDWWIGVRLFKNDPKIVGLFMQQTAFTFERGSKAEAFSKTNEGKAIFETEMWSDALFLPIIEAVVDGYRLENVDVAYTHPSQQRAAEIGDSSFDKKREVQLKSILQAMAQRTADIGRVPIASSPVDLRAKQP